MRLREMKYIMFLFEYKLITKDHVLDSILGYGESFNKWVQYGDGSILLNLISLPVQYYFSVYLLSTRW